jgi:hypothetical protein
MAFLDALAQTFLSKPKSHGGEQKDKELERLKAETESRKSEVEGALLLTRSHKADLEALKASAAPAVSGYQADKDHAPLLALVEQLTAVLGVGAIQLSVLKAENEALKMQASNEDAAQEALLYTIFGMMTDKVHLG